MVPEVRGSGLWTQARRALYEIIERIISCSIGSLLTAFCCFIEHKIILSKVRNGSL